jgi:hypothetical protein
MAVRTETVDKNECITIGVTPAKLSGRLMLPPATDGTSNTIMFSEAVKNPQKLRQGFGLRMPSWLAARFRPGMSVPSLQLLPYVEQSNLRQGTAQRGLLHGERTRNASECHAQDARHRRRRPADLEQWGGKPDR